MSNQKDTISKVYKLIEEYCQACLSPDERLERVRCNDGSDVWLCAHQSTVIHTVRFACSVKFDDDRRIFTITVPSVVPDKNISFEININTEEIIASKDDYQLDLNLQKIIGFLHGNLGYYVSHIVKTKQQPRLILNGTIYVCMHPDIFTTEY